MADGTGRAALGMIGATPVFLYGTLRNREHLAAVLGREDAAIREAVLPGHSVFWDSAERFPLIADNATGEAQGLLLEATTEDVARLDFYELAFGFTRRTVSVRAAEAEVKAKCYFPPGGADLRGKPWVLEEWEDRWSIAAVTAAKEAMGLYPNLAVADFVRRYPMMLARGWSRQMAGAESRPSTTVSGTKRDVVRSLENRRIHSGFFALDELRIVHPMFRGGDVEIPREMFVGTDASLVLPYDPKTDLVVLIEQFRAGPYHRGSPYPWMLEPVAGLIDPGETPEVCALRETVEEAGLELAQVVHVMTGYPSPGVTTEHYHLFVGLCDLDPAAHGRRNRGIDAEGEDIRTHVLGLDEALSLVATGEANVVPLATLLYWTAANRQRLAALA